MAGMWQLGDTARFSQKLGKTLSSYLLRVSTLAMSLPHKLQSCPPRTVLGTLCPTGGKVGGGGL